jgi:hypothetical protein
MDVQVECWRRMTAEERLGVVADLNAASEQIAAAGVRERHPSASPANVEMRVRALRLGRDLMIAAYGWDPLVEGW